MSAATPASTPGRALRHRPRSGWHWGEWGCEALGTALLLLGGISAISLDFGTHSPLTGTPNWVRLSITGVLFATSGSAVALSPLGRRSGAHLNPIVTLAFWTQRSVHPHDLLGYISAQLLGGVVGSLVGAGVWGTEAASVQYGATQPGTGIGWGVATLIEAGLTSVLIGTILWTTSSRRLARWTPGILIPVITGLVVLGGPLTGTSMNPARSLGPALLTHHLLSMGVYTLGPVLGGMCAVGGFALVRARHTLTAKLFHDASYPSSLGSHLPVRGRQD